MRSITRIPIGLCLLVAVTCSACGSLSGILSRSNTDPASNTGTKKDGPITTESKATFLAVGDIMLSRGVHRAIERDRDPLMPFKAMAEVFRSTDFNFGNFESPVSGNDSRMGKGLVFNTQKRDAEGIAKFNFKIVQLANNHTMDQGVDGMRFTNDFMTKLGVEHVGTGENKEEAWRPAVVDANGIKIGFLAASYASYNDGGVRMNPYVARFEDLDQLANAITELKAKCDLIVVAMHGGIEYTRKPEKGQITFARAAIDSGADVVIGGHPHWIQTIEEYKGKYIFYSLGNFIFDQRQPGTTEGLTVKVTARRTPDENGRASRTYFESFELIPVIIERFAQPRVANPAESAAILKKIDVTDPVIRPQ